MFPFYNPQPQPSPLDMITFLKAMDEYYKSLNKKDDKMVPAAPPWGPLDYFILYAFVQGITALCLTTIILRFTH